MVSSARDVKEVILWWELRRIPYNLAVLAAGITTILVIELTGARLVAPGEDVIEPMAIIVGSGLYAVSANLGYSLGWITELLWSGGDPSLTREKRTKISLTGLGFCV